MRWFKHETDAIESEKLTQLINGFGFEGYGMYWRIMELVAKKMDETNRCHYEQPEGEWCSKLKTKRKKLGLFLKAIKKQFKINVVYYENKLSSKQPVIRIEIPNLLEKRDNYTKNLQETNKPISLDKDRDKDKDLDIEKDNKYKEIALRVLDHLNLKAKRKRPFTPCKTNLTPIIARLKDGYPESDLNLIIDNKCVPPPGGWLGCPTMDQYLTPASLFRKNKMEEKINAVPIPEKKPDFNNSINTIKEWSEGNAQEKELRDGLGNVIDLRSENTGSSPDTNMVELSQ